MGLMKEIKAGKLMVKVYDTRENIGKAAAKEASETMSSIITEKGECNVIFAAAPSQNEFLSFLLAFSADLGSVNAFHMDEYIGLQEDAPQSFGNFLKERLFSKANFKSVHYIDGNNAATDECARYAALLHEHPVDVVCMGIGENGHIAFNDPHVARFDDPVWVKIVDLDEKCRMQQVNDGCFSTIDEVPKYALTLTIPAMVSGKYLFCMVPAQRKARAVYHTINDPVSEAIPATCLREHEHAVLYIDSDSASLLFE